MKVLIDTCVWIGHISKPSEKVIQLLDSGEAVTHVAVIGEMSCGRFKNRKQILHDLKLLEQIPEVAADEIEAMIETHRLFGTGIGWVDCHLLASALISNCEILTSDRTLAATAIRLRVGKA